MLSPTFCDGTVHTDRCQCVVLSRLAFSATKSIEYTRPRLIIMSQAIGNHNNEVVIVLSLEPGWNG